MKGCKGVPHLAQHLLDALEAAGKLIGAVLVEVALAFALQVSPVAAPAALVTAAPLAVPLPVPTLAVPTTCAMHPVAAPTNISQKVLHLHPEKCKLNLLKHFRNDTNLRCNTECSRMTLEVCDIAQRVS